MNNWFSKKKKIILLLDQEEELLFNVKSLNPQKKEIGIIYTGMWDIEIEKTHKLRLPSLDKLYPHKNIDLNLNKINKNILIDIKKILNDGPISLSIRQLFLTSYDNAQRFHSRRWRKARSYEESLNILCQLYLNLKKIKKNQYPEFIILPEKIGWMRKFISYFFYSKKIPLYGLMGLRHDQKFAIELCHNKKLFFLDKSGKEMFKKHKETYPIKDKDNFEEYRNKELDNFRGKIKNTLINNFLIFFLQIIKQTKLYIHHLLILIFKRKIATSFNYQFNNLKTPFRLYLHFWIGFYKFIKDSIFISLYSTKLKKYLLEKNKDFIILALHQYPETSTVGEYSYYQNEFQFFEQLLELFDTTNEIIVIDHPSSVFSGERLNYIKDYFNQTPGVKYFPLISNNGVPFDIIKNSKAVISIIGGMALEKARLGGEAYISILHPMLYVKNISTLDTLENKTLKESLDIGNISISANEYCNIVENKGMQIQNILLHTVDLLKNKSKNV